MSDSIMADQLEEIDDILEVVDECYMDIDHRLRLTLQNAARVLRSLSGLAGLYSACEQDVDTGVPVRLRPSIWEKITRIRVVDPDGWREPNGRAWDEPIDENEWNDRMMRSTVTGWRDTP